MHLRRALLLFAIVLGLAAIVTTISQPPKRKATSSSPRGAAPAPAPVTGLAGPRRIRLAAGGRPSRVRLGDGRAATVTVAVPGAGQVDIRGLGLTDTAERNSPASFDVLAPGAGSYEVDYTPAGGARPDRVGTIVVEPPPRG